MVLDAIMMLILSQFNEWMITLLTFGLLLLFYFLGTYSGNRSKATKPPEHSSQVSTILAGMMALLGIMLAFSFSMSSSRFDQRRQLIIDESLDVGTAYFRIGLLSDSSLRKEVRTLLKHYLDARVNYYKSGRMYDGMDQYMKESENIQVLIWAKTAEIGRSAPNVNSSLITQSLNSMIDISGSISGSLQNRVPGLLLVTLVGITAFMIFTMGYSHGFASDRSLWFSVGIMVIICFVLFLIIDMDSPFTGLLKVNIETLTDLRIQIQRFDP